MAERTGNGGHGLVKGATVFGLAVPMIVIVPLVWNSITIPSTTTSSPN